MKGIKLIMKGVCIIAAAAASDLAAANYPAVRGETVQNYYLEKFQSNMQQYRAAIDKAQTFEDAQKLVLLARERVKKAYGIFPAKCDLDPEITGIVKHPSGVTIEKITFQSRKNFTVTANFYRPAVKLDKYPAVLLLAGHSLSGKNYSVYATTALNLANHGVAVLTVDPIHQGERIQYTGVNPGLTVGHNILNRHLLPIGENFSQWRVYDAMRAVDYLISRGDVDAQRIGVTGCSGGGTLTSMAAACDERFAAAAPSCYITTFLRNVENELPVDAEQMPYELLANGGEMADLLLAYAPRPVRILAQERDFFDVRGARETYEMLKKLYKLLGKEENITLVVRPDTHGMSLTHRQAIYEFFTGTFLDQSVNTELIDQVPDKSELCCLPESGVLGIPGEKSLPQIVIERIEELKAIRKQRKLTLPEMQQTLCKLMRIEQGVTVPEYRILRFFKPNADKDVHVARFGIESEKGMLVTLFAARSEYNLTSCENALLYLPLTGCRQELNALLELEKENMSVFGLDYRGIGELEPNSCDQPEVVRYLAAPYNYDYHYSSLGLLLGKPIIGGRVKDVLSAIKLLQSKGAKNITLRAAGVSKTVAILAAILSDIPVKLELEGEVVTFEQACKERITPYLQSFIVPGILQVTDLDELLEMQDSRF